MALYEFHQNNSFGYDVELPGGHIHLVIEADSPAQADIIAIRDYGVYFNGVAAGIDCPCCGDRWCPVDEWDIIEEGEAIRPDTLVVRKE